MATSTTTLLEVRPGRDYLEDSREHGPARLRPRAVAHGDGDRGPRRHHILNGGPLTGEQRATLIASSSLAAAGRSSGATTRVAGGNSTVSCELP